MNIQTAKIFCDIVELKNFSRTAELNGISQSAVSQQLAQLEWTYKVRLIERKKRPIELTAAGEIFYKACKDIIDRLNLLNSEINAIRRSSSRINLAAIFSIGMHTLQPYVQKFMSIYPDINLSVEYLDSKEIYERILSGALDIGVVAIPKRDRNVDVLPFENESLFLACSPAHPLADEKAIDIHQIQGERFIAFAKEVPTRQHIDNILSRYRTSVRVVMEFDNIETIKRAVEINSGISILPGPTLRNELHNGTLKMLEFTNEKFFRPTGILVRKDKIMSKAGQYLIELLRNESNRL
jgi:DNA-binding transcriptional LysR family regulator